MVTIIILTDYTTLDTSTTSTGTLVFTALATDPENDQLTFTMTVMFLVLLQHVHMKFSIVSILNDYYYKKLHVII